VTIESLRSDRELYDDYTIPTVIVRGSDDLMMPYYTWQITDEDTVSERYSYLRNALLSVGFRSFRIGDEWCYEFGDAK
jgi:hypothetical protein